MLKKVSAYLYCKNKFSLRKHIKRNCTIADIIKSSIADPEHFWKLDPDPHQSGKMDPDPLQSEKMEALEGHFGAFEGPNQKKMSGRIRIRIKLKGKIGSASECKVGSGSASKRKAGSH